MKKKLLIIFPAGLIFIIAGFFFSMPLINNGRVVHGAKLANQAIGGLKFSEAEKLLEQKIDNFQGSEIIFYQNNLQASAKPNEIGIEIPLSKNAQLLKNFGRTENFWLTLWQQALIFINPRKIEPAYYWDEDAFQIFWKDKEKIFVLNPPKEGTLVYDFENEKFNFVAGQEGQKVDKNKIRGKLLENIAEIKAEKIEVSLAQALPLILKQEQSQAAKEKAFSIIELAPLKLLADDFLQLINKYQLIAWLSFEPVLEKNNWLLRAVLDEEKLTKYLSTLSPLLHRESTNAQLSLENGKVVIFNLAKEGHDLNITESFRVIQENILEGKQEIQLVFDKVEPEIKTDKNIVYLGLTSLLGTGESNFGGSPANRTHNIKIGSQKLSDVLIKPGEVFSFNENLGEVGPEQGYLPELVIKKDKTIPEYGGGLCQVSTTLFRAAVNSGLKITERAPHAFPVKYYSPQGFDATIYPPHPDLRFLNDTPSNILLQAKIVGSKLIFEIYGTKDPREVKIKGPYVLKSSPDGSMKTVLYQEIWQDGQLKAKNIFNSSYKSPALYPVETNPFE